MRLHRPTWVAILSMHVAASSAVAQTALELQPILDRLDSAITFRGARGQFSGVVSVARLDGRGGEVLYSRAIGTADRSNGRPITTATRFVTASVAKTFTAVSVLQLVDAGRIRLNAPIGEYLSASRSSAGPRPGHGSRAVDSHRWDRRTIVRARLHSKRCRAQRVPR